MPWRINVLLLNYWAGLTDRDRQDFAMKASENEARGKVIFLAKRLNQPNFNIAV